MTKPNTSPTAALPTGATREAGATPRRGRGAPSRLTEAQWAEARALYEAGKTHREVAAVFGISHATVGERARAEGWQQDSEAEIRRRTAERASRIPIHADPAKKDEAIEAEARRRADVMERHRDDWRGLSELQKQAFTLNAAAIAGAFDAEGKIIPPPAEGQVPGVDKAKMIEAFDLARFVKISAETLAIRHMGERKAIGMEGGETGDAVVRLIVERVGKGMRG